MTKFTAANRAALAERVSAGVTMKDAAAEVGLSLRTVKTWLAKGRKEAAGPYAEFVERIAAARKEAAARPEPMDAEELIIRVSEMVRNGSVQAAKLRWEMICAELNADETEEQEEPPLAALDELAQRRAA